MVWSPKHVKIWYQYQSTAPYHSYVFQLNITHAVLLREERTRKKALCYYHETDWEDSTGTINDNEAIFGWCGTCKHGAKKNCKSLKFCN